MPNILIVDDEQSYRQLLSLVFEAEGNNIRTAMNGRQAIEQLEQDPADVIISDVKMPDMDGIEMLRSVRETLPDIGVILMTAFASVETAREAFKLGADDFIQKPFDVEELKLILNEDPFHVLRLLRIVRRKGIFREVVGADAKGVRRRE